MNEQLISGYTAFTTADEFGASAMAEAPGTTTIPLFISATIIVSVPATVTHHC